MAYREGQERSLRDPAYARARAAPIIARRERSYQAHGRTIEKSNAFHTVDADAAIGTDIDANIKSI